VKATTSEHVSTGVDDVVYDLIMVFQQALEDAHRYACFAEDARAAGDDEVASWFDELASSDRDIAQRAKQLMVPRLDA
jgi:rubrerythrin